MRSHINVQLRKGKRVLKFIVITAVAAARVVGTHTKRNGRRKRRTGRKAN